MFWKISTAALAAAILGYVSYPIYGDLVQSKESKMQELCRTMSEVDKDPLIGLVQGDPSPTAPAICKEYAFYWD